MSSSSVGIVITGLAAISAAGVGIEPLKDTLATGQSCLTSIPEEIAGKTGYQWGKAEGFRAADFMPPLKARKFDRCSLFAVVTAGKALNDAGLEVKELDPARIGIAMGCGFGGIANSAEFLTGYFQKGTDGLVPMLFPNTVANAAASNASIEHGLKGPNVTQVQRFCSAEAAFQMACRFLEEGRADIMLAGGVDELNALMIRGFYATRQLRSHAAGFGEGCGILVLERRDHAERRGAPIKGTVSAVRTLGCLLPGQESDGIRRLVGDCRSIGTFSLSGTAADMPLLANVTQAHCRLEIGPLIGRSLGMGGIALTALVMSLASGERGLHLAASPEGPYFAIELTGGASD